DNRRRMAEIQSMTPETPSEGSRRTGTKASLPRVLITIPAYNEGRTLPGLIEELHDLYPTYDLLVINDGSQDDTRMVVGLLPTRLISLPFNLGIGAAVQTGLKVALDEGYDATVQVDGDGQHSPAEVRQLVNAVLSGNYDLAIGSRFLQRQGYQSSFLRRLGIWFLSRILSLSCGKQITDATSGFRALNSRAIGVLARDYAQD